MSGSITPIKKICLPDSILITDKRIFSTLCTGDQRSVLDSYPIGSSPGACNIDMHTLPSEYTEKIIIIQLNLILEI